MAAIEIKSDINPDLQLLTDTMKFIVGDSPTDDVKVVALETLKEFAKHTKASQSTIQYCTFTGIN
jgi:ABC-type Na+ transport system ATPase subunit NatA